MTWVILSELVREAFLEEAEAPRCGHHDISSYFQAQAQNSSKSARVPISSRG